MSHASVGSIRRIVRLAAFALLASSCILSVPAAAPLQIGVAKIDITPERPVHLINQLTAQESEGVHQRLRATALAFKGGASDSASVLVVFDGIGVPPQNTAAVRKKLASLARPESVTICATHDHCAPHLTGLLPDIYGDPMPAEHQKRIDEYTLWLAGRLESVARAAIQDCRPRRLERATGKVGFGVNRRKVVNGRWTGWGDDPAGSVDHSLPLLAVRNPDGSLAAALVTYACHNTSIGGRDFDNRISGDWVGHAREAIEEQHPGALAIVTLGCGGDARPNKHGGIETARRFGGMIAAEVARLLGEKMTPVSSPPVCRSRTIQLSLGPTPAQKELERLRDSAPKARSRYAKAQAAIAARTLARIQSRLPPPLSLPYETQTWSFGDELTWCFLAGEVVVDYAHRIRRDFGPAAWPIAYANDLPCYIPSKRILSEGGYEADQSMAYYGLLQTLLPSTEDRIFAELNRQLTPGK